MKSNNVFSVLNNLCCKCNYLQCACIETYLQDISSVITCSQYLHTETSHQFCDFSEEMGNAKVSVQNRVYSNVNDHSTRESNIVLSNAEQSQSLDHMLPPFTCNILSANSVQESDTHSLDNNEGQSTFNCRLSESQSFINNSSSSNSEETVVNLGMRKKGLNMGFLNVQGISLKFSEIEILLTAKYNENVHVFSMTV